MCACHVALHCSPAMHCPHSTTTSRTCVWVTATVCACLVSCASGNKTTYPSQAGCEATIAALTARVRNGSEVIAIYGIAGCVISSVTFQTDDGAVTSGSPGGAGEPFFAQCAHPYTHVSGLSYRCNACRGEAVAGEACAPGHSDFAVISELQCSDGSEAVYESSPVTASGASNVCLPASGRVGGGEDTRIGFASCNGVRGSDPARISCKAGCAGTPCRTTALALDALPG